MTAKEERDKLEKLIENAEVHLEKNTPSKNDIPELESGPTFDLDYDKLQKQCDKKARKLLKSATGLMIGDDLVDGNSYLKEKVQTDLISLSGMLYQMEVTKILQRDLIEEVRHGAKHPRMYEVFSTLGKTISENNKQLLQTVEAIKETYINLRQNIEERREEVKSLTDGGGLQRNSQGLLAMGSRELINETKKIRLLNRQISNNPNIEDAKTIN